MMREARSGGHGRPDRLQTLSVELVSAVLHWCRKTNVGSLIKRRTRAYTLIRHYQRKPKVIGTNVVCVPFVRPS